MSRKIPAFGHARVLALFSLAALASATSNADTLGYSIYLGVGDARALLSTGSRDYMVDELDVRPVWKPPVVPYWDSSLELEGGFRVGVFASAGKQIKGFGLWVRNDANPHEFSWNWFAREGGQIYANRDAARLRVQFTDVGGVAQMSAIEFLDDIELSYQQNMCDAPVGAVSHVVLVTRGSVLSVASRQTAEANVHRAKTNAPLCPEGSLGYLRVAR